MSTATTTRIQQALDRLSQCKLIPLIRSNDCEAAQWAAEILLDGGFQCIEITFTTPDACGLIERIAEKYPDVLIIAGTVLDQKTAADALAAGAHALVSPVCDEQLLRFANDNDVLLLPGTLTPTEIQKAVQSGAHAVKVFPAEPVGGAEYIKAIRGPLPNVVMIPTGGIREKNFLGYLEAGCHAVGVNLLGGDVLAERDEEALEKRVNKCMKRLEEYLEPDMSDDDEEDEGEKDEKGDKERKHEDRHPDHDEDDDHDDDHDDKDVKDHKKEKHDHKHHKKHH